MSRVPTNTAILEVPHGEHTARRARLAQDRAVRGGPPDAVEQRSSSEYRRRGGGLRLLSWLLWLIPLGIVGGAGYVGYRAVRQIRSKPEVTVGLVQKMTTGEAEKLLSAKGYLKSQQQAMIGTKVAGRVEEMRVEEHDQVKKETSWPSSSTTT